MIDFVEYVVSELKHKRLSKQEALGLIRQHGGGVARAAAALHPLLHRNTSELGQLSFAIRFDGSEFFLRDHRVAGSSVLPAVAYLEMARAALALALPEEAGQGQLELRDLVWAQPVRVPGQSELSLLIDEDASPGSLNIEVCSAADYLHFKAQARFVSAAAAPAVSIDVLKSDCSSGQESGEQLYTAIARAGIELGPAQRGVRRLWLGQGQVLAELHLPESVVATAQDYVLHPSLLDSAVQAAMRLLAHDDENAGTPLPFALDRLQVLGPCEPTMWARARLELGHAQAEARIARLDIDLYAANGELRLRMQGLSARRLSAAASAPSQDGLLLAEPCWEAELSAQVPSVLPRRLLLCCLPGLDVDRLAKLSQSAQGGCHLVGTATALPQSYTEAVLALFDELKALLGRPGGLPCLLQVVVPEGVDAAVFEGLSGLLQTAQQEQPNLHAQLLRVPADIAIDTLAAWLVEEATHPQEPLIWRDQEQRRVRRWRELDPASTHDDGGVALRTDGVYLITGGLGGLGSLFAHRLLAQGPSVQVLLCGRASASEEIAQRLQSEFGETAARVHYDRLDPADRSQCEEVLAAAVARFGRLDGILHAAGTTRDDFIQRKRAEDVRAVLAPKVDGCVHLDHASRDLALDFLLLFSSGVSAFGNSGQADYAAANGFMDGFAEYRNALRSRGVRQGLCLSIHWPLWQHGGMRVDAGNQAHLERRSGMRAMSTAQGMQAFELALQRKLPRLLVVAGRLPLLRAYLLAAPGSPTGSRNGEPDRFESSPPAQAAMDLLPRTIAYLRTQFAEVLKLAPQRIEPDTAFERYGIDSILAMDLTSALEVGLGSLPKTLFFENQSLRELAQTLVERHAAPLSALLAPRVQAAPVAQVAAAAPAAPSAETQSTRRGRRRPQRLPGGAGQAEPIAIVGISGRYPQSDDLDAFWDNLRAGRDCITEVPQQRWDWREYFSEDRSVEGHHYSKWGGFISGVDEFDPLFFAIPPVGAELIDPQERLFLQHAWMAIEDAGYTRAGLRAAALEEQQGQVGVYVGVMYGEYQLLGAESSLLGRRVGVPQSYASIANRVSYVLNLHGPSMTLDTMCSSSLTALHLACQDLRQGRICAALAGGVNISIHPNKYLILSAGQFISSDGHCQSFGEGGDGYIPGEGVGVVVLKRLSDAERDGDTIHGLILGSALNHGGRTNGYSVPNPKAQAAVIARALRESGVRPQQVGYVEAHGTGTKLGDPIEIAALTQVFRADTEATQFCAIGSAKSNIGHCESAAGIAGLSKVLLQMRHGQLVPSLHSAVLNPHIDFAATPFVVNQTLRPWPAPEVEGRVLPRVAGLSSFGAGGSNAHVLVQEYVDRRPRNTGPEAPVLLPLSARTPAQLRFKVEQLLAWLQGQPEAPDLQALAHTLQTGREDMDQRLAWVLTSPEQLQAALVAWLEPTPSPCACYQGQASAAGEGLSVLAEDEDFLQAVDRWIARRKLDKLAELWVQGLRIDWTRLYAESRPQRLRLPTYPFARERYWLQLPRPRQEALRAALHPLLQANTSDLFQQRYAAHLRGSEYFLADHQVQAAGESGQRVLPGVAYLEMARAALAQALSLDSTAPIELHNVAWLQPLQVAQPLDLELQLEPLADDRFEFRIESRESGESVLHCQGLALVSHSDPGGNEQRLDLPALRARLPRQVDTGRLYASYASMGLHYGPRMRALTTILLGQGELLAELELPAQADPDPRWYLPPALLDSALQSALALLPDFDAGDTPALPFALDALHILQPCPHRLYAWVRDSASDPATGREGLRKLDLDLCDAQGVLCLSLRGLSSRPLKPAIEHGLLLARREWLSLPAAEPVTATGAAVATGAGHRVLLCDLPELDIAALRVALPDAQLHVVDGSGPGDNRGRGSAQDFEAAVLDSLSHLQALLQQSGEHRQPLHLVVGCREGDSLKAGLSGLLDSARQEQPALQAQLLLCPHDTQAEQLARWLAQAQAYPQCSQLRFSHAAALPQRPQWSALEHISASGSAWRSYGVYLITGGLGGLGVLCAREILSQAEHSVVVLSGRAALEEQHEPRLLALRQELQLATGRLCYLQLDLADAAAVEAGVAALLQRHGRLDGVLHSAGTTRDRLLLHKSATEVAEVLAPKVAGSVNLDAATASLPLDFFVLFSSLSAFAGNAGQADYAAANAFMDRFATQRNRLVEQGLRRGRSVSILWPLWQDGGMQLDADAITRMRRLTGLEPLQTEVGLRALQQALLLGCDQVLVAEGELSRLQASLLAAPRLAPRSSPVPPKTVTAFAPAPARSALPAEAGDPLLRLQAFLVEAFASLLQIDPQQIDPRAPLENYGIDSVLAMKLIQSLEQHFGNLSKTLLFEYQNLAALATHLLKSHPQIVRERILGERAAGQAAEMPAGAPAPTVRATTAGAGPAPSAARALRLGASRHVASAPSTVPEDRIAIVGLAGRYPQADSLREFWRNLAGGRDCISEVPAERWDHAQYFEPTRHQPGKTYSKWGGFLSGIDRFDALFFNISPKEAELIDPQERLFLETVWHTVEDAGYSRESLAGRQVGVYVGVMWGQYELYAGEGVHGLPSSSFASVANRVSYFFDFHGPSLAVDSMCSSSLSALHLACEALRQGSVELAIAGGVNVTLHPNKYLSLSQGGFASSDGRCRSFGAGGDGYVPGEGVGAVLLKPLQRALADGDAIYGLVRASALNHGGKTNGYTVPNPVAQGDLIRAALQRAGLGLGELDYIETHGTGTSLGDPIEINGLLRAWGEAPHANHQLPIGSVKSNIGHLESAAGIAALSKVLLQFEHGQLLPSLHSEPGNPHIDFASTPFRVQTTLADWPRPAGRARRAGISSFGAGGANAHLIVEEFIDPRPGAAASGEAELCLLSARTSAQLREQAEHLIEALQLDPSAALADIATTLQLGRSAFAERLVLQVGDREELLARLRQWLQTPSAPLAGVLSGRIDPRRMDDPIRLTQVLQQRDLAALAQAWVAGAEIDWTALPRARAPRRIRLPGYPFARERHWIAGATVELDRAAPTDGQAAHFQPSALTALAPQPATPSTPQLLHLRGAWQPSELAASAAISAGATLLLGLPGPLLDAVQEALRAELRGSACVRARPARSFRRQSRLSYRLDYSEPDFARLFNALEEDDLRPMRFVQVLEDAPNRGELLERGLFSLHALCRTLLARKPQARLQILLLGQHAESEQAALHEALAAYLGSLAQENPRFEWKLVCAAPELDLGLLAQRLSDELNSPQNWNQELRYLRAGEMPTGGSDTAPPALHRELRVIEAVPSARADQDTATGLRQAGVYVISGGLGGLGYLFAESLRRQCDARLVLTGRSPLDAAARERLAALDPSGEVVLYIQADVAERAEVHAALETARQRFGAVHGVFHSAGVLRDAYVLQKSREDLQAVLAAKLQGCINLDRATRRDALDLFVLFSSVAAVFGNAGQADYAFANRFLDGFAERRQQRVAAGERQGRSLSINWPYWAEGGMQLDTEALARMRRQYGFEPLPSALGLDFLQQALAAEGSQHIALYGQAALLRARLWPGQAAQFASAPPLSAPLAQGQGTAESSIAAIESYLKGLLGEQIKLLPDRIDSEERFESYGLDSMMVGRLNDRLQADLGELPRTLFYEYASIAELAAHLQAVAAPALARCLRSEPDLPVRAAAPHPTQTQPNPGEVEAIAVAPGTHTTRAVRSEPPPGEAERYAIVGVHVRLPGADTLHALWQALSSGADLVRRVPRERWDAEQLFDPDPEGRGIYCRDGAFLEDVDAFDAEFFGINEEDAPLIDPQERLFLQSAWAAFEDAGYTRDELKRRHPASERPGAGAAVGVFVGVTTRTYALLDTGTPERVPERVPGSMDWSIANRVSYVFDFQGPSLPVDTACSSSLVAIHQACESLRRGECQVALAGGVNLYLHPSKYRSLCGRRMLAEQGRCRSFGAGDDGFVPGEGVGAFVIKPLAQAEADGDHIYALIAGSACAHAGRSNGYSAPSPQAQGELIAGLLQRSGIAAEKVGYVEAHGTGTQLGDSLEVAALSQAFRRSSEARQFCALGSVKSNLGHAEAAAGIAGMAKLLLQLRHRQIAATLHCQPPNPDLDLQRSPFRLPLQLEPWPVAAGEPRRALINGFGAGGVNASLLLEEYLPAPATVEHTGPQLILLSARDEARLREQVQALHARLANDDALDLCRLACTLQRGREAMPQRLAAVVPDRSALQMLLARYLAEGEGADLWLGRVEPHQRRRPSAPQRMEAHSLYVAGEFAALAERWIGGEQLDWLELQSAQRVQRLPLPTYPFERRRYWLQVPPANAPSTAPASGLHPLLRANVSTLQQTAFSAELSAHAWYALDHQVQGQAVLAGAIQLEIACVSAAMASEQPVRRIEDLVWMQPLVLGEERSNLKALLRSNGLGVDCLLVSGTGDGERVLHSEARLICGESELQAPAPVDLHSLRERALRQLDGGQCYRQLAAHGLVYGPGFRTLRELHIGADYALARLELAAERLCDFDQYLLHPSLIDGALQSVLGLASPGSGPLLPFAIDAIELHRPLLPQCLVLVEPARAASIGSEIRQFDLRILNGRGELLLLLRNFYVRGLASATAPAQARALEPAE
ncbi:SDR family NAD(P)-dependent oxidoreductase [Aquimonas sp.]|jgi:polyketide synthase PksL|uniref:SDR family NAD(P)-dependent oxidoreductase n=1 Tax=Aquimonas sp. TaxID=1872588 RepID=UPI0037C0D180